MSGSTTFSRLALITKIWHASFVASHPNLISVDLSNFKCGHDAFISRVIERIIGAIGQTATFLSRPGHETALFASIRIRMRRWTYFSTLAMSCR